MATCAEIVNVSLPYQAGEDSFSHLPAFLGEKDYEGARKHLVMQSFDGRYAIREGNWKLVLSKGSGGWSEAGGPDDPDIQLYDLEKDLREQQNLYLDNPEVVKNLKEKLEMFRKERRSRY
jgi:arylsulfatase A-like enzyme